MPLFLVVILISALVVGSAFAIVATGGDLELLGWSAAALTILTFSVRSMVALRSAALAANVCFIIYAAHMELMPVLALHLLLVPCNAVRLGEFVVEQRRSRTAAPATAATRTGYIE